ncbi:hypothetical protein BH11PLA2_BH11PLA2_25170 [soil metagenome]
MTSDDPQSITSNVDPFATREYLEIFETAMRTWYVEWQNKRKPLRDAIVQIEIFQERDTDFRSAATIPAWLSLGEAIRSVGIENFPSACIPMRQEHAASDPNNEGLIAGFAVWQALAFATEGNKNELKSLLEKAMKYIADEAVFGQHFDSALEALKGEFALAHTPEFMERLKAEAKRLGLTAQNINSKPFGRTNNERRTFCDWIVSAFTHGRPFTSFADNDDEVIDESATRIDNSEPPAAAAKRESEGGKPPVDPKAVVTEVIPPALLSATDIAKLLDRKRESVTSFLTRFAEKNPDCRVEIPSKRRNEPGYMYRTADVLPALEHWCNQNESD